MRSRTQALILRVQPRDLVFKVIIFNYLKQVAENSDSAQVATTLCLFLALQCLTSKFRSNLTTSQTCSSVSLFETSHH